MADPDRGIARDTVMRIGARAAGSLLLGATLLVLASAFSVADFGQFILAYTVGMAIGLVAGLGAPMRVLRVNALDDPGPAAAGLFVTHTATTTAVFVVGVSATALSATTLSGTSTTAGVLVAGVVFAYSDTVQNYAQAHLAGMGRHSAASALGVAQRGVPLAALGAGQLAGLAIAPVLLVAFASTAALGVAAPARTWLANRVSAIRPSRPAGGYWMLSVSGVLTQLQVPAFALFASATTVGWFSLATRVTGPLTLFAAAMSTVLIPELARRVSDDVEFGRIFRRYVAVTVGYLVVVVAAALPAAWLVIRVVGEKYEPAQSMLAGLIVAAGLSSVSQAVSSAYIARGRPGRVTAAIVAGGAVIIVSLIACGSTGAVGFVWAAPVVGQFVVLAVLADGFRRREATTPQRVDRFALVASVLVAVVVGGGVVARSDDGGADRDVSEVRSATAPITMPSDLPAVRILLVGDSLVEGTAFGGRGDSNWTRIAQARLSRRSPAGCPVLLRVVGRGGAGYSVAGTRKTTFLTQVRSQMTPDVSVVILSGSNNDATTAKRNPAAYRRSVHATIAAVRRVNPDAEIVVTSALVIPGARRPAGSTSVKKSLQTVTRADGVELVDPNSRDWFADGTVRTVLGADGRHPTDLGHRMIAAGMAPVIDSAARKGRCL